MASLFTERFLYDAGGWKEMGRAKALVKAGAVREIALSSPGHLEGEVEGGGRRFRTALRAVGPREVEGRCTCLRSRREGIVCDHALALGYHWVMHGGEIRPDSGADAEETAAIPSKPRHGSTRGAAEEDGRGAAAAPTGQGTQGEEAEVVVHMAGSLSTLRVRLEFTTPDGATGRLQPGAGEVVLEKGDRKMPERSVSNQCVARTIGELADAGFAQDGASGDWILRGQDEILRFLGGCYQKWRQNWRIVEHPFLTKSLEPVQTVTPVARFEDPPQGENWFSMTVEYVDPMGRTVSQAEIQRLLQSGKSHWKRPDGNILVADPLAIKEWNASLSDADARQIQPGVYQVNASQKEYLQEVTGRQGEEDTPTIDIPYENILRIPPHDYQKRGIVWLTSHIQQNRGGILADDMGLGKSLQALTAASLASPPTLVVCPASLRYHWFQEAEKCLIHQKCLILDSGNIMDVVYGKYDASIFIVSYELMRDWIPRLQSVRFGVILFDEAQALRNPKAKTTKAAGRLQAGSRIALTGTPVENALTDLWSIAQCVEPGYLGSLERFKERHGGSGMGSGAPESRRLGKRLRPLMLRRLKSQVARELPPKTVQTIPCELTPMQDGVTRDLMRSGLERIQAAPEGKREWVALTVILRLRQAALDLRLLGLDPPPGDAEASGKLEVLREILEETALEGRKTLVFSQFRAELQILAILLTEWGIPFAYLDGQTKNRHLQVEIFQNNPKITAFLISLKAGGTGLNLQAADTVVFMEPWWNPAVEEQAADRAHRIGQTNPVHVVRLISRNSIEEKILDLQKRKHAIREGVFDEIVEEDTEKPTPAGLTSSEREWLLGNESSPSPKSVSLNP